MAPRTRWYTAYGEHTAELIDDSRFILIEGMAHNIQRTKCLKF